jgi:hypothetical protein
MNTGVAQSPSGKMVTVTRIVAPSGRRAIVAGIEQQERLSPRMVGYLDRRLGIESPFAKIDDPEMDP